MREAGLSNQFCLSVCQSSVQLKRLKSRHIDPHKPSIGSQTIAKITKNCSMLYLTDVKDALFSLCFSYFQPFITLAPPLRDLRVPSRTGHAVHLETSCFEMTARKHTIYVLHRHRDYGLGCLFQLFPIIRNIWPHLINFTICTLLYIR